MKKSKSPIKKKKFEMPSSIAILILLTIALAILTHLIPAGEYTRVDNVPIAGTYTVTEPNPQGIWDILAAPMEGFRGAIDIILFVFVLSGCLGILGKSRSLDAGLMYVINRLNGREKMMIPIVMIIASVGGTTFGFSEETIPFYPILIPMFMAMGYDAVSACMVLFLGAGAGIVGALINPFSVGIGSSVAGISLADGMLIRVVLYVAMVIASILFTMHYAEKVRKDPTKSVVYDMRSQIETHINTALHDSRIETEARRIVDKLKDLSAPNSPNKTHFMVEISPHFDALASTKDNDRLFAMLPYKSLCFTSIKDRHGVYAMINKDERRDVSIRKPRPSIRKQLADSKQATSPKKAAARTKKNELEV